MDRLIIFGAGGHGRVVADAARRTGRWREILFSDDRFRELRRVDGCEVVGPFAQLIENRGNYDAAALGVGDNRLRLSLATDLRARGVPLPAIVHPDATVALRCNIDDAAAILARAVVQNGARIGFAAIVNTAAVVEHDCLVEPGAHLSSGACLGGDVVVREGAWVGLGAVVINGVTIGRRSVVGAGAAVTQPVPDGVTVAGVPARVLRDG